MDLPGWRRRTIGSSVWNTALPREAEPLDGGYWIPAPVCKVDLDGESCLLAGVHPTAELRRHFGSVRRAGMGSCNSTPGSATKILMSVSGGVAAPTLPLVVESISLRVSSGAV
jgi:hypothetical protein